MITQIIFEGGLVLIGCVLAFQTRNLGSALGEAKQLIFAMYNVALCAVIVLLMGSTMGIDQKSVYVIMTVGVFWSTVFSSCAFVLPRIMQVQRNSIRRRSCQSATSSYYHQNGISCSFRPTSRMTAPLHQSSAPTMYLGGSLYNEPRSKVASDSQNSVDYNVELTGNQTTHSEPWNISSLRNPIAFSSEQSFYDSDAESDLHASDAEEEDFTSVADDDEGKQKQRNTSFTKMSISPSESDILRSLGESDDTCHLQEEDIEANTKDDDDNETK